MTVTETASLVGRTASLQEGALVIGVAILDVRSNWGRTDYLVTPRTGSGKVWVQEYRLTLDEENAPT